MCLVLKWENKLDVVRLREYLICLVEWMLTVSSGRVLRLTEWNSFWFQGGGIELRESVGG